jgi:NAD(P)-dependent dehydrogenase (short-subunit alcohol dehydrogenase family)
MKELKDKVAVITGAASGIGRALADNCFKEGMKVVLADIEEPALLQAEKQFKAAGADVLAVVTDVSKAEDVENLAQKTLDKFGAVNLLFNNAGVGGWGPIWENTIKDWQWILGVNLWGVVHGIRTFIPIMIKQDSQCHVVNTASGFGLITGSGIYGVTKHGVVALTEILANDLRTNQINNIKVSVLCPGIINTRILDSDRNRQVEFENEEPLDPEAEAEREEGREKMKAFYAKNMAPKTVADITFQDIRKNRLYIVTDDMIKGFFQQRSKKILKAINAHGEP